MGEIILKPESYKIIGACFSVHKKLGAGFLESVYSEALGLEFTKADIPFEQEKRLPVYYEGLPLKKYFKADFVCYSTIILELKSSSFLTDIDCRQALNYLKATQFQFALLINFSESSLTYKRIIN
jgi:GxxExxY protein